MRAFIKKGSEHVHQAALFDLLRMKEPEYPFLKFIFAVPNASKRHPSLANYLSAEGMRSGVWDLFVPFQRHGYGGLWIEMKFGKNVLSKNQKEFEAHFKAENYRTEICSSWDRAAKVIENYLDIKLMK
jgi:hypothetical protein